MFRNNSNAEVSNSFMEQQNNERISELSDQVSRLKGLTKDINLEVQEQNSLLENMNDGFSGVSHLLGNSLEKIGTMLQEGGPKNMCYMISFVVFAVIFMNWVFHFKGKSGA